jgi:hypothetical protein
VLAGVLTQCPSHRPTQQGEVDAVAARVTTSSTLPQPSNPRARLASSGEARLAS